MSPPPDISFHLTVGQCAALATIMEATAPKPGNVHRGADFEDLTYPDFLVAATLVAGIMEAAADAPLGQTILSAVETTRQFVETNVNLGTILLVAPLAKVSRFEPLIHGIHGVLGQLTPDDARDVYAAIRLARPGGLGEVAVADVGGPPPDDLLAAMRLAAAHDLVARQYAEGFEQVLGVVVPSLSGHVQAGLRISDAIVRTHLELMSQFPDSLIARKRGIDVAQQAAAMARRALDAGRPGEAAYEQALADLDFWLRADGHFRNPGTTADLIAAGLFAALRDGIMQPPYRLAR